MENIQYLDMAISTVVRQLRGKAGLSQEKFADFASLSRTYIAQLETGSRGASLKSLMLIGRSVGLSGAAVVTLIEDELRNRTR